MLLSLFLFTVYFSSFLMKSVKTISPIGNNERYILFYFPISIIILSTYEL
jgi:hypothetical protein